MSEARDHNLDCISSWLHLYGNEYPGGPQDLIVLESRKLEGKALIKGWYTIKVLDSERRWDSHSLLRTIVDTELKQQRWFLWINLRDVFLADPDPDPTLLDKWLEDGGVEARLRLGMFDDALEWIADRIEEKRGKDFRLSVPILQLATVREIGKPKHKHEKVRSVFTRHRKELGKDSKAIKRTAQETGYSQSQVERITGDLRSKSA